MTATKQRHVVNFSGGACSFWTAARVAERFGTSNLVLLFADVLIEDKELYEFNAWTADYFGVPITRVSRELTPWQLFRKEGLIANNRSPICSIRLKREVLDEWHEQNCDPLQDVLYVGFDWTEPHRVQALREAKPNWTIAAPMAEWPPAWDKCKMIDELTVRYGKSFRAYQAGFAHNNCGRRCVRAGISHFVRLYETDPESFLEWEREEAATQQEFFRRGVSNWNFTVLRDRRGGVTKRLSFSALRERIIANDPTLPKHDWGGCGCGGVF